MPDVKTFKASERCQDCGALKREHLGFALVCPPLPESRPVPDQRDVREHQRAQFVPEYSYPATKGGAVIMTNYDQMPPIGCATLICQEPSDGGRPCMLPKWHDGNCANWNVDL